MFLPVYSKAAKMTPKHIFLLLLGSLSVSLCHGWQVVQPKTQAVNPDGTVTIDCEVRDSESSWRMEGSLRWNNSIVCLTSNSPDPDLYDSSKCFCRKRSFNHFQFTLFDRQPGNETTYVCEFVKMIPTPVIKRWGAGTKLVSALEQACSPATMPPPPLPQCTESGPLNWVLMGLAGFLFLCTVAITCAYIRLRVQQEKEMDGSLTYVPMQPPQSHSRNMRKGDPESNTTYMDMRKMQLQGSLSGKDMNYNSHQMNY